LSNYFQERPDYSSNSINFCALSMDSVTHFDDILMRPVAEDDDESAMDVTPRALSPSRRGSLGESAATSLWSTPLSGISGLTGGGGGIGLSSVRLLYCIEVEDYCGGVIKGSGNERFCGRLSNACLVQSHKTQKVVLIRNHLYIRAPRGDQVLSENCLNAGLIPENTVTQMLEVSKPIDLWLTYFLSLTTGRLRDRQGEANDSGGSVSTGSEWEHVSGAPPTLSDFDRARANLRTPKRLKVGPLLASLVDTSPSGGVALETLTEIAGPPAGVSIIQREEFAQDALFTLVDEWGKVKGNFDSLNMELRTQAVSESQFRDVLASTISALQGVVHDSDSKIQLLASRIGENRMASDGGSLTCWDAIKQLQEEMESMKEGLPATDVILEKLRMSGDETEVRLKNLGQSFDNMASHYRVTIVNFNDQLARLSRRNLAPSPGYGVLGLQLENPSGNLTTDLIGMRQRIKELEDHRQHTGRSSNRSDTGALDLLTQDVRALERVSQEHVGEGVGTQHLERSITIVREKLKEMEGRVTDSSFRLNQYTFSSFFEVRTWCEDNTVATFGIFWDLFSVLVAMKPKFQTGKDIADELFSSARIKSTPFENDLVASMSHPRPLALFGKKNGELAPAHEGFGACATYEEWVGSGCESVKSILSMQLTNYVAGVLGTLDFSHPTTPFVTALMTEVQSQWNHVVSFIETFHNDLLYVAKFTKPKAWRLLGRTMAAVFESMSGPRSEVARLTNGSNMHGKSSLIWAVLRCHRSMQQFVIVKFRGHPAVVKEMTLFMLTERVDPSEIGKLVDRVKEAELKATVAQRTAGILEKEVATLKRNYDNLVNDVKQLKTKVK
jgi:hypothetical protein